MDKVLKLMGLVGVVVIALLLGSVFLSNSSAAPAANGLVVDHSGGLCSTELGWADEAAARVGELHVYGDALNKCHVAKDVTGLSPAEMQQIRDEVGGLLSPGAYSLVAGGLRYNHPNPPASLQCDPNEVTILKWYRSQDLAYVGHIAQLCSP